MKSWQTLATCKLCGFEKIKRKDEIPQSGYVCGTCNSKRRGKELGNRYGKSQKKQGSCLDCYTPIRKSDQRCRRCHSAFMSKRMSGENNPAWNGNNVCECGSRKSTGALFCRSCSFKSGMRSGENNGRFVSDDRQAFLDRQRSAKVARNILSNYIKARGIKKISKTEKMLKYSFEDFKKHIDQKLEDWMNWSNYGLGEGKWNIDHIVPISKLNEMGITDIHIVNALCNLRPMCSIENIKKSNKIDDSDHEQEKVLKVIMEMLGR